MQQIQFPNLWVYAKPAPDVPSQWEIHCLDLDIVTMGDSLRHAISMLTESIAIIASDDLANDRNPLDRRAPEEEWQAMLRLFHSSPPQRIHSDADLDVSNVEVAMQINVTLERWHPSESGAPASGNPSLAHLVRPSHRTMFMSFRALDACVCSLLA